jgi:hypothetical protein
MNLFELNRYINKIPHEEIETYNYYHAQRARYINNLNRELLRTSVTLVLKQPVNRYRSTTA